MGDRKKLTPAEEVFCQEYIVDLNATQAYMRAFKTDNAHSASVLGCRLLGKARIQLRISELKTQRAKRVEVSADFVLRSLLELASVDIAKAFNDDGCLKPISQIPPKVRRAIGSIQIDEIYEMENGKRVFTGFTKRVKFWPKDRALEMIGRHLKLFTDKLEIGGGKGLADKIAKARKRKDGGG